MRTSAARATIVTRTEDFLGRLATRPEALLRRAVTCPDDEARSPNEAIRRTIFRGVPRGTFPERSHLENHSPRRVAGVRPGA